jgi:tellurite resistance protein
MIHEPTPDAFGERRKSLEEAFFKDRDQQLMAKMRSELEALEEKRKLAQVSGIVEERVLHALVQAGVKAETLAAVSLVPLVEVAWVDGSVSPEERAAVLNAAVKQGIQPDSAPYEMLQRWLQDRPDPHIVAAWKDYVREVSKLMPPPEVAEFKRNMLDRATRVAEAAGGFLGLATISKSERAKIDELAKAFEG